MPRRKDPRVSTSISNEIRRIPMDYLRTVLQDILNRDLGMKFRVNKHDYTFFRPDFCTAHGYRVLVPESMRKIQTTPSLWVWRREDILLVPHLLRDGIIRVVKYEHCPHAVDVAHFNRAAYVRKLGPGWQEKSLSDAKKGLERNTTTSTIFVQDNINSQSAVRERTTRYIPRNHVAELELESEHRESSEDIDDGERIDHRRMRYNAVTHDHHARGQNSPTIHKPSSRKRTLRFDKQTRHASHTINNNTPNNYNTNASLHPTVTSANILSDYSDSTSDSEESTEGPNWRDSIKSCRDIYKVVKNDIVSLKGFMAESVSVEAKKSAMDCCYILERNLEELKKEWLPTEAEFHKSGLSDTQRTMLLRRHAERALNAKEWRIV